MHYIEIRFITAMIVAKGEKGEFSPYWQSIFSYPQAIIVCLTRGQIPIQGLLCWWHHIHCIYGYWMVAVELAIAEVDDAVVTSFRMEGLD